MVDSSGPPVFSVTVDAVVFALRGGELSAVVVRRGRPPYDGRWALPGGFVDQDEDLEQAARRELREETGLDLAGRELHQLGAYGRPDRDPRGRVVSVAHVAVVGPNGVPVGGDDAAEARWQPLADLGPGTLAFDHDLILGDALAWVARSLEQTDLAAAFLPETFTVAELRTVYEVVWDRSLDAGNFQRKVTGADGFLVEAGRRPAQGRGRPATLYRRGPAGSLWPPLSRERDQ